MESITVRFKNYGKTREMSETVEYEVTMESDCRSLESLEDMAFDAFARLRKDAENDPDTSQ